MLHLAALMLECLVKVSISLKAFSCSGPTLGVLIRPCSGFKQRLSNIRELGIQVQQNRQPEGTHGFLSWCSAEVLNKWLASCHAQASDAVFEMTNPRYLTSCLQI